MKLETRLFTQIKVNNNIYSRSSLQLETRLFTQIKVNNTIYSHSSIHTYEVEEREKRQGTWRREVVGAALAQGHARRIAVRG
ncbi:hypothetical protein HanPSC8_Chr08g0313821 [Helianthus annuus]|nr:hypothetical protein HanPSC8_Chr08g0313821 [Helianthus annuus]